MEISALKGTGIRKAAEKAISIAGRKDAAVPVHTFAPEVESVLDSVEAKLGSSVPEAQKRFLPSNLLEKDDKIQEQMAQVPDVSEEINRIEKNWMMIRKVLSPMKDMYIFPPLSVNATAGTGSRT